MFGARRTELQPRRLRSPYRVLMWAARTRLTAPETGALPDYDEAYCIHVKRYMILSD